MCLDRLSEKGSIVKLCKKDKKGNRIGYKIFKQYESELITPFLNTDVLIGINDKCKNVKKLRTLSVKPIIPEDPDEKKFGCESRSDYYSLGYHVYALKKDAQIVLKCIKKESRAKLGFYDYRKYVIAPIHFNTKDIITEGIEDYLKFTNPEIKDSDRPTQSVIILKQYTITKEDYKKTISKFYRTENIIKD